MLYVRVPVLQILAALSVALIVVFSSGSHTAWAEDPDVTRGRELLQTMMDDYSGPPSESGETQLSTASSGDSPGTDSATSSSTTATCWGKSHNIHRSGHPLTRGNVTAQADTWCLSRVNTIMVAAILFELRGDEYVRIASAPIKIEAWTDRDPVTVNPGARCALDPLEHSTYAIVGFHVVVFSGGELGSAITANAGTIRC